MAGALRALGQGAQPDLRPRLPAVECETLLVVGARDGLYRRIADEMIEGLPRASLAVVRHAGHPVVGERPETVAEAILAWAGE
jgi:2-succinyl-6-hydroxy-2,4-cyclohexadiene-1-carboxylate synthase